MIYQIVVEEDWGENEVEWTGRQNLELGMLNLADYGFWDAVLKKTTPVI